MCTDPSSIKQGLVNAALYTNDPFNYLDTLYLNCTVGGQDFSNYRHCTYNRDTDVYEMQGSPYDCGGNSFIDN